MIQELLSFGEASLCFPAFCLNLHDFEREQHAVFTHAVFSTKCHLCCRKRKKKHEYCISVDAFKPFFRVQKLEQELIYSLISQSN